MQKTLLPLFLLFICTSCAMKYQQSGLFQNGYKDSQIDKNTFVVTYTGSNINNAGLIYKFCLMRAAQVTKNYGYSYFNVISNQTLIDPQNAKTTSNITIRTFHQKPVNPDVFNANDMINQMYNEKILKQK